MSNGNTITITAPRDALILALRVLRHEVSELDAICGDAAGVVGLSLAGLALASRRAYLAQARAAYVALTDALGAALDA